MFWKAEHVGNLNVGPAYYTYLIYYYMCTWYTIPVEQLGTIVNNDMHVHS